jgi:acyl-CoA synthetase (AMP-forming)/AMP-acid ligase II
LTDKPSVKPPFLPTIPAMLHALAAEYGPREAYIRGDDRITFGDLECESAEMAKALLALGLGKGSRVALLLPNSTLFLVAFMAVTRIGAIASPLSTLYQAPELAWILNNADFQMLLTVDRYLNHDYLARLEDALPSLRSQTAPNLFVQEAPYLRSILVWGTNDRKWALSGSDQCARAAADAAAIDSSFLAAIEKNVSPADLLCVIHTSGSTANPKGVVHAQGPWIRQTYLKSHAYWPLANNERIISVRPFFWVAGLSATLFHSLLTGCCLITPDSPSGSAIRALIEKEKATALCGDENWFRTIDADSDFAAGGYAVFRLNMDCAALAVRSANEVRFLNPARDGTPARLPDDLIARSYGMTETIGAHTTLENGKLLTADRSRFCGQPLPGVVLRVVDPKTHKPVAAGEVGELLVGGTCMMAGLYKKEPSDVFTADGLYPTGDLCLLDEHGYLQFKSRLGEMIKIHGANVAPLEVELTLNALPEIERSAVFSVLVEEEVVLVAAVQLRQSSAFDEDSLRKELRKHLSSFKVPKRIFALAAEDFPVTGSGKIRKSELAARIGSRMLDPT